MSVLTYYNPKKFNGVLILLREPHDEKNSSNAHNALEGNKIWFQNIISEDIKRSRQETKYRNRFLEMLTYCGESELEKVAFANIKLQGGGSSASEDYRQMNKKEAFDDIIKEIGPDNLKFVFTVADVFNAIVKDVKTENGLMYNGKKYNGKHFHMAKIDGVTYYEILHPCRSPRIKK